MTLDTTKSQEMRAVLPSFPSLYYMTLIHTQEVTNNLIHEMLHDSPAAQRKDKESANNIAMARGQAGQDES